MMTQPEDIPIPKKSEPHWAEFEAVRSTLSENLDMIAWMAVIVAYGKSAHAWRSGPFTLTNFDQHFNEKKKMQFVVAVVNATFVDDLGKPEGL